MKKLLALLLALVMVLSFAACSGNDEPVVDENNSEETSSEEQSNTEDPAPVAETYKLGMGIVVSTKSSKEAQAQVDATVAVVVTDSEGKIVKCELDCAQTKLAVADGLVPEDFSTVDVRSKQEKKEDYGMQGVSAIGAEWYTQADAFAAAVVGMTADDVAALELVESNGHNVLADETLHASCSMDVTSFKAAIAKACADEYAKEFTADSFTLGLGVNTSVASSKSAAADANGVAALYTNFAAAVVAEDGTLVATLLDVIQPKVEFDATGAIVTVSADYDAAFRTKKELKEDYGMKGVSAIGLEWMEQATNFEAAVVGMTSADITGIETVESNGHNVAADETLHASCSMDITEFQATLAKAFANAR